MLASPVPLQTSQPRKVPSQSLPISIIQSAHKLNNSSSTQSQSISFANINYMHQLPFWGGWGARARSQAETPSLRKIQSSASVHQPSKPAPASQPVCHIYHVLRRFVNLSDSFHSQHLAIKQHSIKLSSHDFVLFIPAQFPFHGLGHCHLYHNRQSLDRGDFHSCALATRELGI